MGRKRPQKKPSKKDYGYIKEKLTSSIHKGLTILEIKGRDKSPLIIVINSYKEKINFFAIVKMQTKNLFTIIKPFLIQ